MNREDFPVDLLSGIISLTSPRDACRSALVSRLFRSASDSDYVWQKLLPSDYKELISQSATIPETIRSGPKKDLYFYLCNNPIRIGNGTMSFSIDRASGKKCFMVGARGLSITWGIHHGIGNGFLYLNLVAKLRYVWWLHVIARVETRILSPQTTYVAYLVFNLAENEHDFQNRPVQLRVDFEGRENVEGLNVVLDAQGNNDDVMPKGREDGWMEVEMGEFFNEDGEDGFVVCSLMEVDNFRTKSGLIVEGIELRPTHV